MTSFDWNELGFRPYALARQGDATVELMSFPFETPEGWCIMVREPGDPTTLRSAPLPPDAADYAGRATSGARVANLPCQVVPKPARERLSTPA